MYNIVLVQETKKVFRPKLTVDSAKGSGISFLEKSEHTTQCLYNTYTIK